MSCIPFPQLTKHARKRWRERFPDVDLLTEWVNAKELRLPSQPPRRHCKARAKIMTAIMGGGRIMASDRVVFVVGVDDAVVTVMPRDALPGFRE